MPNDDPRVTMLDQALMTLDTYRGRGERTRSLIAVWRSADAARIVAALPSVGLVLLTKNEFDALAARAGERTD